MSGLPPLPAPPAQLTQEEILASQPCQAFRDFILSGFNRVLGDRIGIRPPSQGCAFSELCITRYGSLPYPMEGAAFCIVVRPEGRLPRHNQCINIFPSPTSELKLPIR